jgi:hypothetical protein
MKITLIYISVLNNRGFDEYAKRFLVTYALFRPTIQHELIIRDGAAAWDIGTFQQVVPELDCDLAVCLGSAAYFHHQNWLEPFVAVFQTYGPGLYGPQASYENRPHIRTAAFAVAPRIMCDYPVKVHAPDERWEFEWGERNITAWTLSRGCPVFMVTKDGCREQTQWRNPDNIFRRGDQSNCLIKDRHNDIYQMATPAEKARLEKLADAV